MPEPSTCLQASRRIRRRARQFPSPSRTIDFHRHRSGIRFRLAAASKSNRRVQFGWRPASARTFRASQNDVSAPWKRGVPAAVPATQPAHEASDRGAKLGGPNRPANSAEPARYCGPSWRQVVCDTSHQGPGAAERRAWGVGTCNRMGPLIAGRPPVHPCICGVP
jgi:hypothetical protein